MHEYNFNDFADFDDCGNDWVRNFPIFSLVKRVALAIGHFIKLFSVTQWWNILSEKRRGQTISSWKVPRDERFVEVYEQKAKCDMLNKNEINKS